MAGARAVRDLDRRTLRLTKCVATELPELALVHGISRRHIGSSRPGNSAGCFGGASVRHGVRGATADTEPMTSRASRLTFVGPVLASAHSTDALAELADCGGLTG